ncbi:uncharacterized protein BDW43DRAFT_142215 [Aspergillus alliaceus]|uniref:uncharacterized protein n=1 Tax=Petromyces alliaceus TaxID=209559 RepID=UPI0012A720D9|nr:uncharacterized protein BDW43DRAFT_142215 [Aspergillus alliaceus]KAB8231170.1 hypothetical protein BDW43DRAFT_142215 [Aspergillus alliaceus]
MMVVGGLTPVTDQGFIPLSRNGDSAKFANGIGLFDLRTLRGRQIMSEPMGA